MSHFNDLTPAEVERLAMLIEECGEVIQIASKVLRHGYDSYHPNDPSTDNRELLSRELTDLISIHVLMMSRGDLREVPMADVQPTIDRKMTFTHHQ